MITRRDDISLDIFYDYWSDIHGVLAARAEGAFEYFQHRLGTPIDGFLQGSSSIDQTPSAGDAIVGLAEITFETSADREKLIRSAAVGQMVLDEQNVLKGTYMYSTGPGNAATIVDRTIDRAPQGPTGDYQVLVFLRRAESAPATEFRAFVRDTLMTTISEGTNVLKARLHLLEAYDAAAWPTPNVDHQRTISQQYDAYIELAFDSAANARRFTGSVRMAQTIFEAARLIAAATTYPDEIYTMVFGGRPTQAGLRGLSAFRTLRAINEPENERSKPLLNVLFGDAVLEPLS
ncbi:hypothetical protein [Sphingomonas sp. PAMC 26605]|uniref:hypothetical protein n=1 Tax=Sphingomonas sp. PAMC 26605 TaxID=1112214 RepID=UPI00026CB1A8|nr:hypothetical protein [Sphingomonas sp. PAMC 26605]